MTEVILNDRSYQVDSEAFLLNSDKWDENFVEAMAPRLGISDGLVTKHWEVIRFIRKTYEEFGRCPLVYQTCKLNGLRLKELENLFPTGYMRGACKLAGITYKESYLKYAWAEHGLVEVAATSPENTYEIDSNGFLVRAHNWSRQFAVCKAWEMKVPGGLSERHWQIINFLRSYYQEHREVPTVFETCEHNGLELDELEKLFPDGYHRGAVKIAGLKVR